MAIKKPGHNNTLAKVPIGDLRQLTKYRRFKAQTWLEDEAMISLKGTEIDITNMTNS